MDSDIVAGNFQAFDSIEHASGVVMSSPNQATTDIIPLDFPSEVSLTNLQLPERLFATDRYPERRLNVYSRPEYLSFVYSQLKGTEEWNVIKRSSFGQLFNLTSSSGSEIETVEVSDGSPDKQVPIEGPTELEESLVNIFLKQGCNTTFNNRPDLDNTTFYLLRSILEKDPNKYYVTENNFSFYNRFLLVLAKPSAWVDTQHMEILMDLMGTMHACTMASQRSCFVSPMFVNHIIAQQKKFENAKEKYLFEWSPRIQSIVRKPGSEWIKDVDCVYLPMIWGNRHWVGLVVNLRTATIQVLDPNVDLTHERDVKKHISLLASAIPFIMGRCCSSSDAIANDQRRFNIVRVGGLYQNRRGGDCGPVSVKFLEMHAHGDVVVSGSSMTDETVDELRKQYVVDIYRHYIVPLHIGRLSAME